MTWIPGAAVGLAAALIAAGSFWWVYLRRGDLVTYIPPSFGAYETAEQVIVLLPLVLYNAGALPIVVLDVRLTFVDEPYSAMVLPWVRSRGHLTTSPEGQAARLPVGFVVDGRHAEQHFLEFELGSPPAHFAGQKVRVRVDVRMGHLHDWRQLITFTLQGTQIMHPANFITYSNVE